MLQFKCNECGYWWQLSLSQEGIEQTCPHCGGANLHFHREAEDEPRQRRGLFGWFRGRREDQVEREEQHNP